jgi:hypothetical protein
MKDRNIQIHTNVTYDESFSKDHGYDITYVCLGQRYSAPYMKDNFSRCIAQNGQIYVNNLMQVIDSDPKTNPLAAPIKQNMFSFGDCCLTSRGEEKNIPSMRGFAPALAQNIKDLAAGKKPTTEIPNQLPISAWISLGPEFCVQSIGDEVEGSAEIGAIKVSILEASVATFKAPQPEQ